MYEAHSLRVPRAAWNRVIGLLDHASRELEDCSESAHATIVRATSLLREQIGSQPPCVNARINEGLLRWQVRRLLEFIDARIATRVTVSDLCAVVQLSQAHFSRRFRRAFGETPHEYLMRRRLEGAMRLMLGSSVPMKEVALQCGFADQAHLCRRFRRVIGESPAAWRRARRTGPSQATTKSA
jgi:AraC family transcriptional regulator